MGYAPTTGRSPKIETAINGGAEPPPHIRRQSRNATSLMISADGEQTRSEAAQIISNGGVIAFLTDTFYGLGADPFNRVAIQRIKQLKGREDRKPILIIISDREQ